MRAFHRNATRTAVHFAWPTLLLLFGAVPHDVTATVPERVNIQGTITSVAGAPPADGTYGLSVRIYELAVPPQPPAIEQPLYEQAISTYVAAGAFSFILDPALISPPDPGALSLALASHPRFVEITVQSGPGVAQPEAGDRKDKRDFGSVRGYR